MSILYFVHLTMIYSISLLMLFHVIPFLHLHHFCLSLMHTLPICLLHILIPNTVNSYPLSFPLFLNICLISHLFASLSGVMINSQIKKTSYLNLVILLLYKISQISPLRLTLIPLISTSAEIYLYQNILISP